MNPKECGHHNFRVEAEVGRILSDDGQEPPTHYHASIRLNCVDCGAAFEWQGVPNGLSPYQPTVSLDGQELRIPVMPPGEVVPKGLPGFRVAYQSINNDKGPKQ